jgi:hypothetical protein
MWYSNLEEILLDISSTNIDTLGSWLYQCIETRSIEVFRLLSQPLHHLVGLHLRLSNVSERISRPNCEPLYATNTSHIKQETFLYEYPFHWVLLPTKNAQQTLLFGSTILKYCQYFDYWNQPLNVRMRVWYLECHEAGLCWYLVIHIENLLHLLQLSYFRLWPIYWFSLVYSAFHLTVANKILIPEISLNTQGLFFRKAWRIHRRSIAFSTQRMEHEIVRGNAVISPLLFVVKKKCEFVRWGDFQLPSL